MSNQKLTNATDHGSHSNVYVLDHANDDETQKLDPPHPDDLPYRGQETMMAARRYIDHMLNTHPQDGELITVFGCVILYDTYWQSTCFALNNIREAAMDRGVKPEVILRDLFWFADMSEDPEVSCMLLSALRWWLVEQDDDPIEILQAYRQWVSKDQEEFRAGLATVTDVPATSEFSDLEAELSAL